jgi:tetratricopeptide (TPR) repeat protein
VVAEQLGETDQAEEWYRQALARNGQWRPSWSALAGLWARTGRWEQLQEAIAALETMAGAQAEAAWWRGRCALARGDLTRACEVLGDACVRWPEDTALTRLREEVGRLAGEQEG